MTRLLTTRQRLLYAAHTAISAGLLWLGYHLTHGGTQS